MKAYLISAKAKYTAELAVLKKRTSIVYQDEFDKCRLTSKLSMINELLELKNARNGLNTYRVEYVDYIDAVSEIDAVEIFNHSLDHVDATDENIDVYEVDSHHKTIK